MLGDFPNTNLFPTKMGRSLNVIPSSAWVFYVFFHKHEVSRSLIGITVFGQNKIWVKIECRELLASFNLHLWTQWRTVFPYKGFQKWACVVISARELAVLNALLLEDLKFTAILNWMADE